jgi:hypothetical protein
LKSLNQNTTNLKNLTLPKALTEFKRLIESAIQTNGEQGKNNLIRSQKPIKLLHDVVKAELLRHGIAAERIKPILGDSAGELALAGFLKRKDQDICVVPQGIDLLSEMLTNGLLIGQNDEFGKEYTERTLSINVRSQLSSLSKNFDTMYERTFAEALNLHLRCPRMCCGEIYLIPVYEYDAQAAAKHEIRFVRSVQNVEKYVLGFEALNNRSTTTGDEYKYEKVCLLLVDFTPKQPVLYTTTNDLKRDGLLPANSPARIENLVFTEFVPTLIRVYKERFGNV